MVSLHLDRATVQFIKVTFSADPGFFCKPTLRFFSVWRKGSERKRGGHGVNFDTLTFILGRLENGVLKKTFANISSGSIIDWIHQNIETNFQKLLPKLIICQSHWWCWWKRTSPREVLTECKTVFAFILLCIFFSKVDVFLFHLTCFLLVSFYFLHLKMDPRPIQVFIWQFPFYRSNFLA